MRICLALITLLLIQGCGGDTGTDPGGTDWEAQRPDIVALTALDWSFFDPDLAGEPGEFSNYQEARTRVQVKLQEVTAPVQRAFAAWAQAAAVTPTVRSGSPQWDYVYADGQGELSVSLTVSEYEHHTDWSMTVDDPSADPPLEDAIWLYVTHMNDDQEHWISVDALDPEASIPSVNISWGDLGTGPFVRYSLTHAGGAYLDDRTTLSRDGSTRRLYSSYWSTGDAWSVRWDETAYTGMLRHPDYNSGLDACWDGARADAVCSN